MSCNYCNKGSLKTSEIKFFLIEALYFFMQNPNLMYILSAEPETFHNPEKHAFSELSIFQIKFTKK